MEKPKVALPPTQVLSMTRVGAAARATTGEFVAVGGGLVGVGGGLVGVGGGFVAVGGGLVGVGGGLVGVGAENVLTKVQTRVSPASGVKVTPDSPALLNSSPVQVRPVRFQFAGRGVISVTV
jgi:hypothetical protein